MENLNDILLFIEVAKMKSFSGAARSLNMQKSTLSRRLGELEYMLGVTLLRRTTRQVVLTAEGEKYYQACLGHIEALLNSKNVFEKNQKEVSGEIRVTAPVVFGQSVLPILINEFQNKYKNVQFNLLLDDRTVDLVSEKVDIAIRAGHLKDSSLKSKRLGQNRFILVSAPKIFKNRKIPTHPRDLINENAIIFRRPSGDFNWLLTKSESRIKIEPNCKVRVNHLEAAKQLCLEGVGVALIPTFLCKNEIKSGELIQLCPDWCGEVSPVTMVYPSEEYPRRLVTEFREFAAARLLEILKE